MRTRILIHSAVLLTIVLLFGCISSPSANSDTSDANPDSGGSDTNDSGHQSDGSRDVADDLRGEPDLGCNGPADCSGTTPLCLVGRCRACDDSSQCNGMLCLPNGACGECTTETADVDCAGNVCDPKTFRCTNLPLGGDLDCTTCTYDAECIPKTACVNVGNENRCLFRASEVECDMTEGYTSVLSNQTSANGSSPEDFCVNETISCEAIVQYRRKTGCADANNLPDDSLCEPGMTCVRDTVGTPICTLVCGDELDCPGLGNCDSAQGHCVYP